MIQNIEAHKESFWSFNDMDKNLPGAMGFSDLDAMVERNGQFLVMEFKNLGAKLSTGQKIMLEALSKIPEFTVVIVWGPKDTPVFYKVLDSHKKRKVCGKNKFNQLIRRWYNYADKK